MSVFVTGTGTGVGKTVASAALMRRFRTLAGLRYWKPVQTGKPPDCDASTVRALSGAADTAILPNLYSFPEPRSPHRAAELAGSAIAWDRLVATYAEFASSGPLIVEGAGGVLVPLDRRRTWFDLLCELRPAVVLVAGTGLGTINHTLLSIRELRRADLTPAGVIFCGPRDDDNLRTIADFGGVPELGCFVFDPGRDAPSLLDEARVDPDGVLVPYLSRP